MKLHFRSNDLEGQLWQQRTVDRLRRALGRLHGLVASRLRQRVVLQLNRATAVHQPMALVPVRARVAATTCITKG